MLLTLVITTFNRREVLRKLLQSLEAQTDPTFEVVVVMDNCTDGTREMLETLETSFSLKWLDTHCKGYGLAVARNLGILAAEGEAVVILDDDGFPQPGFVEAHKQSVRQGVITGGPRTPAELDDERQAWKMRKLARLPACKPMGLESLRRDWPNVFLVENNICLYREDWISMGLFSERIKLYGFIGQEFFARAEYLGYSYQYNTDARIVHDGALEKQNGLPGKIKSRHVRVASALRPSLMTPRYFDAQVRWANARADGNTVRQPNFWWRAGLTFPYRYARGIAREMRRRLKYRHKDRK